MCKTVSKTVLGMAAASLLSLGMAQSGGMDSGGMQSGGAASEPGVAAQSQVESGLMYVNARNPGGYIATGDGRSLYTLVDSDSNTLPCETDCLTAWPPYTGEASLNDDEVLDSSLLGTVQSADGEQQVTYNGYPLYFYSQDEQPGALSGQGLEGFDGNWYIVGSDGEPLESDPLLETGQ